MRWSASSPASASRVTKSFSAAGSSSVVVSSCRQSYHSSARHAPVTRRRRTAAASRLRRRRPSAARRSSSAVGPRFTIANARASSGRPATGQTSSEEPTTSRSAGGAGELRRTVDRGCRAAARRRGRRPGLRIAPQSGQSGPAAPRAARARREQLRPRQRRQTRRRIEPCTSTTSRLPPRSCSVSMFCVTTACTSPRRSSSASARCAAFGSRSRARRARRVEAPDARRIAPERLDRRHLERIDVGPDPGRERKSGIPLSVETPAPVSTTQGCRSRTSLRALRRAPADRRLARGRLRVLDRRPRPLRGDGRAGNRAPRLVPRLVRGRPRRLARRARRRLPADPRARDRGADDRGLPALPPRRLLRRPAPRLGPLRRRPRRALPYEYASSATASSSPTARRRHATSTARPTARPACPAGWSRRSLRASRRRAVAPSAAAAVVVPSARLVGLCGLRLGDLRPHADDARLALVGRRPRLGAHERAVRGVDLAGRATSRVGAEPSSSTTVLPLGSVGSSTRSTGTGPVTTSGAAELSTRRLSPP